MRLLLLSGLLLLIACDKSEENSTPAAIRGRVLDAEGHAMAHVGVVVSYELPYPSQAGDTLIADAVTASPSILYYTLPTTQAVLITVNDRESTAVLDTLVNQVSPAGWNLVEWDLRDREGRLLAADIYLLRLVTATNHASSDLLVNPDYTSADPPCRVLATTAADGSFAIRESELAFRHDVVFGLISSNGWPLGTWELDRRVRVHALDESACIASSAVVWVDPAAGVDVIVQAPTE